MPAKYTDEIKAQVISQWTAGASLDQLASSTGITKSTIQGWVKGRTRTLSVRKTIDETYDLDQMAWELVGDSFSALRAILRKSQDDSWLDKQDANNLAIFFGVTSDKLLRLLAAGTKPAPTGHPLDPRRDNEGEAVTG